MAISNDDVVKVAKLSRLALSGDEVNLYTEQLGKILHFVEKLNAVETSKVDPMITAAADGNVFRPDVPKPTLDRKAAFASAPAHDDEFFRVPAVIE
ncbi:MAG: Asp-tRNA(Asn)/Glu-tRNA(Gln) amidotransferase subunit GatC [Planctomycetota bacterium]